TNTLWSLLRIEDIPRVKDALKSPANVGPSERDPLGFRHRNGAIVWLAWKSFVLLDPTGRPIRLINSLFNVTAHKNREELLQNSNAALQRREQRRTRDLEETDSRLSMALAVARMGVWEWDIRSNELYWSP